MTPLVTLLALAVGSSDPPLVPTPEIPPTGAPAALTATDANAYAERDYRVAVGQAARPCPDVTAHPFRRLPRVCPVLPCPCTPEPGGMTGVGGGHGHDHPSADGAAAGPAVAWIKEFDQAAHVPLPRFSAEGCVLPADGLLIYEGMRLVVYADGSYDLSFTATVPDMPVVLRLQLVFDRPDGPRITLPPIRMAPPRDAKPGDVDVNTFHVAHRGYSALFRPVGPKDTSRRGIDPTQSLYRVGTARFGTPVALEDPTR